MQCKIKLELLLGVHGFLHNANISEQITSTSQHNPEALLQETLSDGLVGKRIIKKSSIFSRIFSKDLISKMKEYNKLINKQQNATKAKGKKRKGKGKGTRKIKNKK